MRALGIGCTVLLLGGCAPNMITFGQFFNSASFIDSDGNLSEGRVITNYATKDGVLEFPKTKYGALSGKFSTQTPRVTSTQSTLGVVLSSDQTVIVPALGSQTIESGNSSGQAFLTADGKVVLRCRLSVDFNVDQLRGGVYTIGSGVCTDANGKISNLQFTR